jgi:hypothetical protein
MRRDLRLRKADKRALRGTFAAGLQYPNCQVAMP